MWTLLTVATVAAALAAQESATAPLVDMPRRVLALTGADPVDCGGYPLRREKETWQGATRDQLQAAVRCAQRAIRDGRPFWTYNQRQGIDSWIAHGLLRTSGGELRSFSYDSAPCGGPGCEPQLSVDPCREPYVRPATDGDPPEFSCRAR